MSYPLGVDICNSCLYLVKPF
uniref:Uncharacterized protein n=1 Tax=Rhizophora mucronata TaxID=61149 RepID=A0A2P2QFR0_RHIMU